MLSPFAVDSAARHSHSNDRSDHRHGNKTNSVASWSRALSHSSNDSSSMSNTKCAKQRPLTSKTADNGDLKRADLSHHVTSAAASSGANGVRTDVLPPPHSSSEPLSRFAQDVNPKPCDSAAAAPHPGQSSEACALWVYLRGFEFAILRSGLLFGGAILQEGEVDLCCPWMTSVNLCFESCLASIGQF